MEPPELKPNWWTEPFEGRPLADHLATHDIGALFRFLRSRGFSRSTISGRTGLAETRVRCIANGEQMVESYQVLLRIADGLGLDRGLLGVGSQLTQAADAVDLVRGDPADDADFVGSLAMLAVDSVPAQLGKYLRPGRPGTTEVPRIVTTAQVELMQAIRDQHRQIDAAYGGGACRSSAVSHLSWASDMLNSHFESQQVEHRFKAALSDLYQVAGWASHDLGDHAAARHFLTAGLVLARDIEDVALIAGGFYRLGRVSIHQGRAKEALRLWQLGQLVAQDSGNLAAVAVLHANEGWAYAMLGDADRVCDSLSRAQGELNRVEAGSVPAWARFFLQPADLDGISGVIYGCLARHPEHRSRFAAKAIEHSERSYEIRGEGEERSKTFDAIATATGYLLDGQTEVALAAGHRAVDHVIETDSRRARDRLQSMASLARSTAGHVGIEEVVERVLALEAG